MQSTSKNNDTSSAGLHFLNFQADLFQSVMIAQLKNWMGEITSVKGRPFGLDFWTRQRGGIPRAFREVYVHPTMRIQTEWIFQQDKKNPKMLMAIHQELAIQLWKA